jgi:hypothetical protein
MEGLSLRLRQGQIHAGDMRVGVASHMNSNQRDHQTLWQVSYGQNNE